jgi:hypothetical protein
MAKWAVRLGGLLVAGTLATTVALTSVSGAAAAGPWGRGGGSGATGQGQQVYTATAASLSAAEADGLTYMREEEKLARDVYQALGAQWELSIFTNIAASEQRHMDSVLGLLDRYGLSDPAADSAPGEFTNDDLQALYDRLVEQGSRSLADAIEVGIAIEQVDIADLEDYAAASDNSAILRVYDNLTRGSHSHLRAFTTTLEAQTS